MNVQLKHFNEQGIQLQVDDMTIDLSFMPDHPAIQAKATMSIEFHMKDDRHIRKMYSIPWEDLLSFIMAHKPGGEKYFTRLNRSHLEIGDTIV